MESRCEALPPNDNAAGRKVWSRDNLYQLIDRDVGIVQDGATGIDHFAKIVRRYVRRHPDSNTARPIDQQIRKFRGKNDGFLARFIIIRLKIDGILVDIIEQFAADSHEPDFGVTHRGRRVPVHGAEIALAVDQRQTHRKYLRHTDHGIVNRLIAMGMVFTHDIADDTGRLTVGSVPVVIAFVHHVHDAAMNRFQPVAHVRQGPTHDHAHRVIEIGFAHLVFDRYLFDIGF